MRRASLLALFCNCVVGQPAPVDPPRKVDAEWEGRARAEALERQAAADAANREAERRRVEKEADDAERAAERARTEKAREHQAFLEQMEDQARVEERVRQAAEDEAALVPMRAWVAAHCQLEQQTPLAVVRCNPICLRQELPTCPQWGKCQGPPPGADWIEQVNARLCGPVSVRHRAVSETETTQPKPSSPE